ncbi:MAG: MBL fold metallo-hydrolase [Candidatus Hadarchaeia archaeon]
MTEIVFLGCGGGRLQTVDQTFRTGGFRIHDNVNLHVDPGPGALLLSREFGLDPNDLDGLAISHSHPDHYADAEIMIESIGRESPTGGILIGNKTLLEGIDGGHPAISRYHMEKIGRVVSMTEDAMIEFRGIEFEATRTEHSDPKGIGFNIHTESGTIGYTGDTQFFDGLQDVFSDVRVLIANVTRPDEKRIDGHLCSEDLIKMLKSVQPEMAVILHMGMLFLQNPPGEESSRIEKETGVKTISGFAGTKLEIGEKVRLSRVSRQGELNDF